MLAQGDFWILVFVGLLIANLALLFYVKSDFDKKVGGLSQEVKGAKENLANDKNVGELLREVKGVKESLLHVKQDFDKRMIEILQEVNDIKGRLILDLDKKVSKLSQEVEGIQVKDIKDNLIHIQQNFDKKLAELLQEVNDIKVRLILELGRCQLLVSIDWTG